MNFTAEGSKIRKFINTGFAIHCLALYLVIPVFFCPLFMGRKELKKLPATFQCKSHTAKLKYFLQIESMGKERQLKYFSFFIISPPSPKKQNQNKIKKPKKPQKISLIGGQEAVWSESALLTLHIG